MQRLFNIDKWTRLEEKQSLQFLNEKARNVRLEVNAPVKSALWYICQATGETHFLALVEGRDTVEFGTVGPFELTVEGPGVMVYTADGDDISQKPTAESAFVKVMERRRRNPELEHIAYVMQINMERRFEQQASEIAAMYEQRLAAAHAVGTGAVGDAPAESAPPASPSGNPEASGQIEGENANVPDGNAA